MIQSVETALAGSVTGQTQCPNCGHKGVSGEAVCTQCGQSMYTRNQGISDEISAETDPRNIEAAYEQSPAEWEEGSNKTGLQAVALEAAWSTEESDELGSEAEEDTSDPTDTQLSKAEQDDVRELQDRDQEVRAHEQAHIAAGGNVVQGSASYTYETGPDGKQYAIGGEVSVDVSSVPGDPEATQEKAQAVRRSAMAPASPSAQDQNVAAKAAQMEAEARTEKQEQEVEETQENNGIEIQDSESDITEAGTEAMATSSLTEAMKAMEQRSDLAARTEQTMRNSRQSYAAENDMESSQIQKARFINNYV